MDLNQNNNIPAVLGMIDSEKEFDSIEWSFIQKNPNFFNFGDSILNWIKTMYKHSNSCIINNRWTSLED